MIWYLRVLINSHWSCQKYHSISEKRRGQQWRQWYPCNIVWPMCPSNVIGLLMCKANLFFKKWQFHTSHLLGNLFFFSKETRRIRSNQTLEPNINCLWNILRKMLSLRFLVTEYQSHSFISEIHLKCKFYPPTRKR